MHTEWNLPSLCFHLHLFSLVFLHVAVCVRKMGRCTHSLSELCVCCVSSVRVGDVFFRTKSNSVKAVTLLYTVSPSTHSSMDIMYTTSLRKKPPGQTALLCFYTSTVFLCLIVNIFYEKISTVCYFAVSINESQMG